MHAILKILAESQNMALLLKISSRNTLSSIGNIKLRWLGNRVRRISLPVIQAKDDVVVIHFDYSCSRGA